MTPTLNTAAALPMRQSCDRCHKQKLRCARTGNSNTGACDRCLRKRAQCVYSSSLPKGRPSLYNSADTHSTTKVEPSTVVNVYPSPSGDSSHSKSSENTSMMPTDPWPWVQSLNVDDSQIDWGDQDSGQQMFNWHPMMNPPAQIEISTACITAFPVLPDRDIVGRDGNGDNHEQKPPGPTTGAEIFSHFSGYGNGHSDSHFEGKNNVCFSGGGSYDADAVIAELAQLSVRLTPLCRSSHHLAKSTEISHHPGKGYQKPLIDDAAFESVAGWLAHGSVNVNMLAPADCHDPRPCTLPMPETKSTGVMLCHVLSASHHLLKILHYLQANIESSSSYAVTTESTPVFTTSGDTSYFAIPKRASLSYPDTPNSCLSSSSDDSIRNLVIACHTMLLNIYIAVLVILERDADSRSYGDKSALGDIRLVSIVQLCAYLINRQHQAMDQYLSPESPLLTAASQDLDLVQIFGALQHDSPKSDPVTRQAMKDLKIEVHDRLTRLQRTLCI